MLRHAALALPLALVIALAPPATAAEETWADLREALFQDRPISEAPGVIALEAPYRAQDAAVVPITVEAGQPQTPGRYIRTITLVIDENPAPVAAVFHLTPESGLATLATRVRINSYTHVRAIAETSDGALHMAARYVKASGGCSAPALKDQDAALARLGRMKLKQVPGSPAAGSPGEGLRQVQLLVSHPNYSGLQMDPLTRNYLPPHYVEEVTVSYGGRTLMTVEGGISLSEDPSLHFFYRPDGAETMAVTVRDSEDQVFEGEWPVAPNAGS